LIFIVFHLTREIFNYNSALIAALITAILPEFIYTSCLAGTTIFFHLGIAVILLLLYRLEYVINSKIYLFLIGITSGILILFRSEVILFLFIIFTYYLTKKRFKHATIILFVSFIFIIPWGIRNTLMFKEFVPLSTSFGLNFYRGHNPYSIGVWADQAIADELLQYKNDPNFELRMNELYINKALENLIHNPPKELEYIFIKLYHLWVFNPNDERTGYYIYIILWFLLITFFVISIRNTFNWQNQKYLYLFLLYFHLIVILFFCLPRYQTMMKIGLVPFSGNGIWIMFDKIKAWRRKITNDKSE
jgi:4-amino-4-deoxy-L-arabinose transferase-like glycosyltransferase